MKLMWAASVCLVAIASTTKPPDHERTSRMPPPAMIGCATASVFGVTYLGVLAAKEASCERRGGVLPKGARFCVSKATPSPTSIDQPAPISAAGDSLKPTQAPTFAPTPSLTNPPKPDFTANEPALRAKITSATVNPNALLQSSSPTVAPTPHPTEKVCPCFFLSSY